MPYVYSTLATSVAIQEYHPAASPGAYPRLKRQVVIQGGAGVANKHFQTPNGIVTKVTDEEAEFLAAHDVFIGYLRRGFMTLDKSKHDVDSVVTDMEQRDNSAPLRPEDFEAMDGKKVPTVGAPG